MFFYSIEFSFYFFANNAFDRSCILEWNAQLASKHSWEQKYDSVKFNSLQSEQDRQGTEPYKYQLVFTFLRSSNGTKPMDRFADGCICICVSVCVCLYISVVQLLGHGPNFASFVQFGEQQYLVAGTKENKQIQQIEINKTHK